MIIGVLKNLHSENYQFQVISGDVKKFAVPERDVFFKLNVNDKSEKLEYKFIPTEEKYQEKYYIFRKSDIVNEIKINKLKLNIISGAILKDKMPNKSS